METIKVYRANELKKNPHIKLIKEIAHSRSRTEREFISFKLDIRHLGKNQYCILGIDWYLYYKVSSTGVIEIELLEAKKDNIRMRERAIEIITSLKELLLAYSGYIFIASLNHNSKRIYEMALRKKVIAELYSVQDDTKYFTFAKFFTHPQFVEQNGEKEKILDFKRVQQRH